MGKNNISVIIPNYNYGDFIIERIDSILRQTYPVAEMIILDDASSDDSVKIIKEKIKEIKQVKPELKIRLLVDEENSGGCVFGQWQKGLENVTGEFVWIAEADDSADEKFLETAMEKFKRHQSAVLFYSDSRRINQYGKVLSETSVDLEDLWGCGRWTEDYYNDGEDEIKNYLSANNTIINVSGVVWKNADYLMEIFEEAQDFKIAGDWYIYTRVLEHGDIVYSAEPLNYYRKHDKGSVSTVTNLMQEYKETLRVQERVAVKYSLSGAQKEWQKKRRKLMGFVENEKNIDKKGRMAWLVPDFKGGYGGHRTIFQNINEMIKDGYACDLYVKLSYGEKKPAEIYNNLVEWYGDFDGDIFTRYELVKKYDGVVATSWDTAKPVLNMDVKNKLYFIQDYERWFFPMSENHLEARESYKYGFKGISIGKWLSNKISGDFGAEMRSFSFCADLDVYKRDKNIEKEDAVCFIYQPDKPRRCAEMGLRALQIVKKERPETKIYLYGSEKKVPFNLEAEHLGLLSVGECNKLYNKCRVGLCMSSSNPSRIPFEMMAAGLPVVDLYLENNLYDFPEEGCLLAEPSAEAVANAILKILNDSKLEKTLSEGGVKYMKDFPLERGFEEFKEIIKNYYFKEKVKEMEIIEKIYKRDPMVWKGDRIEIGPKVYFRSEEEIRIEKLELENQKKEEERRNNLTIAQRIFLKIRYVLLGY